VIRIQRIYKKAISKHVSSIDKIQLKKMNITFNVKQQPDSIYINESGLYSLLISSKTKKAKKFIRWLTSDVIPSLRKKDIKTTDTEITLLLKKISELENKNKLLQNDLKQEKFPEGAMVYVIEDFDIDNEVYYKIGKTDDMNKRIKIYDTHTLHKRKVVEKVFTDNPIRLETCIRSMLYDYRYKNKKDFYLCDLDIIKKAFKNCKKSINNMNQKGGGLSDIDNLKNNLLELDKKIIDINKLL